MIDWAATGQMLSGVGAIGGAGAIVIAAIIGGNALSNYRAQKLVDREIHVAEDALRAAYRASDAVEQMRGRWIAVHETENAEEALRGAGWNLDQLDQSVKSANVTRAVIYKRAEFLKDDFDEVFKVLPFAKVYFGQEIVDNLRAFIRARNRMLVSADMLPHTIGGNKDDDRALARDVRRDIFGASNDEPDEIAEMVKSALNSLETQLLPKLKTQKVMK